MQNGVPNRQSLGDGVTFEFFSGALHFRGLSKTRESRPPPLGENHPKFSKACPFPAFCSSRGGCLPGRGGGRFMGTKEGEGGVVGLPFNPRSGGGWGYPYHLHRLFIEATSTEKEGRGTRAGGGGRSDPPFPFW